MGIKEHIIEHEILDIKDNAHISSRYLKLTGGTLTGGLTIVPSTDTLTALVVNDKDANPVLNVDTINNRVGIGTTAPTTRLHLAGTTSAHYEQNDVGLNFYQVARPSGTTGFTAVPQAVAGNVNTGTHYYSYTFVTALGETSVNTSLVGPITTDITTAGKVLLNIPIGTDYRVTKRRIYRSLVGTQYNLYLLYEIPDNTTTTYTDNKTDAQLGTVYAWYKPNTTNALIQVSGAPALFVDSYLTTLGVDAGKKIGAGGGYYSTFVGASAGVNVTSGAMNTFIGSAAGTGLSTATGNVVIGECAGIAFNTTQNVFIGNYAANGITAAVTDGYNVVIGGNAAYNAHGAFGYNTLIGQNAGYGTTTSVNANNICIGYCAGRYETGSSKLFIDSLGSGRTNEATARTASLLYGVMNTTVTSQTLTVNGHLGINNVPSTATLHITSIEDVIGLVVKANATQTTNLQEWQDSSGTVKAAMTGTGRLFLLGSTVNTTDGLKVQDGVDATTGTYKAISSQQLPTITANSSADYQAGSFLTRLKGDFNFTSYNNAGIFGQIYTDSTKTSGTTTAMDGMLFSVSHLALGTVTGLVGAQVIPSNRNAGTVTNMYGYRVDPYTDTAYGTNGTVTNYYGFYQLAFAKGANTNLTNQYGIYLNDINQAGTLNYAIYTKAGLVRFGDAVETTGNMKAASYNVGATAGVDGTFTTVDLKTVTVTKGIITSIV